MKVRINETIATTAGSYQRGSIYDIDDAEAKRLIEAGQATDDLGEKGAVRLPQRQTMDRPGSTPVENLTPGNTAQPSQTAAGLERQAAAEVDKHGVATEEPTGGEANRTQHPAENTAGVLTTETGKTPAPAAVVADAGAKAAGAKAGSTRKGK